MWPSRHGTSASPIHATPMVASFESITEGLAKTYKQHVLEIEKDYRFDQFYSPMMTDGDFLAKPMVLLLGQYSTGKTTFIRHLLEKDYPGLRIGPEPTTDKFVAVCHSDDSSESGHAPAQVLPGHAAVVDKNLPWSQLESFGPGFLSRFEVVHVKSHVFKGVTLIDTPGVLAGNKQWERGYDFEGVIKWFGERVDSVLIFFDAHKLDISDEFRRCILALKGFESKVSILLNKADSVNAQHLMRVYGALMWSLGKVMSAPEVPRIYIGSFWDQPLRSTCLNYAPNSGGGFSSRSNGLGQQTPRNFLTGRLDEEPDHYGVTRLFEQETDDLFKLIYSLPARSASRKIDDFLKRVKKCYTHCVLIDYMRRQLPQFIGKNSKQRELLDHLEDIYDLLSKRHQIPVTDFPPPALIRSKIQEHAALSKFPKMDPRKLRDLDVVVKAQVAALMKLIPREESNCVDMHSPLLIEGMVGENGQRANVVPTLWLSARQKAFEMNARKDQSVNGKPRAQTCDPTLVQAGTRANSSITAVNSPQAVSVAEAAGTLVELLSDAASVESVPAEGEAEPPELKRLTELLLKVPSGGVEKASKGDGGGTTETTITTSGATDTTEM